MDYNKIYLDLITRAILRPALFTYTEKHHITPRSMGGGDESENIVSLTLREHIVAHKLLYKAFEKDYPNGIFSIHAFYSDNNPYRIAHRKKHPCSKWILRKKTVRGQEIIREFFKRNK